MGSSFRTADEAVAYYTELIRQKDAEHDEYIAQSVEVEKELEQQLSQTLTDVKALKSENLRLRNDVLAASEEQQRLIEQCASLQDANIEATTNVERLTTQVRELESKLDAFESSERIMEASMDKMEQEKNALLEKVALLESDVEVMQEYEANLQRLRDEIKELKDDANVRLTRQPDRGSKSRDRSASPAAQLARHDTLYDELQKQVQNLNLRLNSCRSLVNAPQQIEGEKI